MRWTLKFPILVSSSRLGFQTTGYKLRLWAFLKFLESQTPKEKHLIQSFSDPMGAGGHCGLAKTFSASPNGEVEIQTFQEPLVGFF